MHLESQPPMRAAGVGQEDGGARYQKGHHDGKENPDRMPGREHTHLHQAKPENGSEPAPYADETIA
jgi:hypothetical protein